MSHSWLSTSYKGSEIYNHSVYGCMTRSVLLLCNIHPETGVTIASSPGHPQILSRSCGKKSGSSPYRDWKRNFYAPPSVQHFLRIQCTVLVEPFYKGHHWEPTSFPNASYFEGSRGSCSCTGLCSFTRSEERKWLTTWHETISKPSRTYGDYRTKLFTIYIRPEEKKKVQLVHSLAPALTLTQTLNHLANKPQEITW